jgi:hypothetical protein
MPEAAGKSRDTGNIRDVINIMRMPSIAGITESERMLTVGDQ